jgi:hypothetical protein
MKTTHANFLCLLAMLTTSGLIAADTTANTELKMVASALQPVLEKLDPRPEVTWPGGSATLLIGYKSQMYKIHARSMTGEVFTNTHDALGPSFKGFVLRVHLQNKGEVNQAATPQTLREPYWQTDLDVTPLYRTEKQVFWGLSYGVQTDTNLLAQVRQTMRRLKDSPNKPVDPTTIR